MSMFQEFQRRAGRSLAPATVALCVAIGLGFLLALVQPRLGIALAFKSDFTPLWGMLTYPFASGGAPSDFIWVLLGIMWLWGMGASVERDLGTPKFLAVFFGATFVGAIAIALCVQMMGAKFLLAGPLIPVGALTVVWGTRNAGTQVLLMMVLPVAGRWLAWITAALVFYQFGVPTRAPVLGLFACLPLALGYLVGSGRLPGFGLSGNSAANWPMGNKPRGVSPVAKKNETLDQSYYDDVRRREREREERERLRKLFEGSMDEGPSEK
jgi:membrane associated rhomboid family serine protease